MATHRLRLAGFPRTPLPEGPFDLAIVGGGINGAAIARDAVLRELSVCLLEKEDFAYGTSSRSSKMLHGGIRYLEQAQLGLVFESLKERALQLRLAPHLSSPQSFVIPAYQGASRGLRWIRAGLFLYDLLAAGRRLGKARALKPKEVIERVPGLRREGLLGGGLYFDAVMDDARLCLLNVLDARDAAGAAGRLEMRNYAEVLGIRPTSPLSLEVHDRILNRTCRILAHRAVRAVGPWTGSDAGGRPLLVPSKGVHLVLPALGPAGQPPHGLLLTHPQDQRPFFVIPWRGKTVVGTTETPFCGSPDRLRVEPKEVEYLLGELKRLLPDSGLSPRQILATFAGVRPLAASRFQFGEPGKISRKHRIVDSGDGIVTLVGGKYTTYRAIAAEVLNRLFPGTAATTHRRPLPGGEEGGWEKYRLEGGRPWIERFGEPLVERLFNRYGCRLGAVLGMVQEDPTLGEPLAAGYSEIRAEVVYGVLEEEVRYPADFLARRTDLRFEKGNGAAAYQEVERLIQKHAEPLGPLPPDLDPARERYLEELRWEDVLRGARQGA